MFELPTAEYLKLIHKKIHFFGLGFIQVKVDDRTRFHFYTDKLPGIMPVEEVHNHRYDFTSYVLKGALRQEIFQPVADQVNGDHDLITVTCKPGEDDIPSMFKWRVVRTLDVILNAESSYTLPRQTYHRVRATHWTVTRVVREAPVVERAAVMRPVGVSKVCPFSKEIPEAELWDHVESILRR